MTDRTFVKYTEINDHESETWHSWLQIDGNEQELAKLRALLDEAQETAEFDLDYTLTRSVEPEPVVDKLVEYGKDPGWYSPHHSKVVGRFTCPESLGEDGNQLYKGALFNHFQTDDAAAQS